MRKWTDAEKIKYLNTPWVTWAALAALLASMATLVYPIIGDVVAAFQG